MKVAATAMSQTLVTKLKSILHNHPGKAPVFLHMVNETGALYSTR